MWRSLGEVGLATGREGKRKSLGTPADPSDKPTLAEAGIGEHTADRARCSQSMHRRKWRSPGARRKWRAFRRLCHRNVTAILPGHGLGDSLLLPLQARDLRRNVFTAQGRNGQPQQDHTYCVVASRLLLLSRRGRERLFDTHRLLSELVACPRFIWNGAHISRRDRFRVLCTTDHRGADARDEIEGFHSPPPRFAFPRLAANH